MRFQMANSKGQMANVKQFEICHLPFEIPFLLPTGLALPD
jgi:hypothetical protein